MSEKPFGGQFTSRDSSLPRRVNVPTEPLFNRPSPLPAAKAGASSAASTYGRTLAGIPMPSNIRCNADGDGMPELNVFQSVCIRSPLQAIPYIPRAAIGTETGVAAPRLRVSVVLPPKAKTAEPE